MKKSSKRVIGIIQPNQDRRRSPKKMAAGIKRRAAPARKRARILCPVRNCRQPGAGPKHQWFCAKHSTLPAKTKKQAMARRNDKSA